MRPDIQCCARLCSTAHNERTGGFIRKPVDDKQFRERIVGGEAILKTLSRVVFLASSTFVRECLGFPIFERELQNVAVARGQTSQLRETRAFEGSNLGFLWHCRTCNGPELSLLAAGQTQALQAALHRGQW